MPNVPHCPPKRTLFKDRRYCHKATVYLRCECSNLCLLFFLLNREWRPRCTLSVGGDNEAARFHQGDCRLRSDTSIRCAGTTTDAARHRLSQLYVTGGAADTSSTPFLNGRRVQLAQVAAFNRLPAIYTLRESVEVGGLMSYGSNIVDAYRQVGVYVGRILKGAKPGELPIVQATKFELVINAPTARMLGLTIPTSLLNRADEVID